MGLIDADDVCLLVVLPLEKGLVECIRDYCSFLFDLVVGDDAQLAAIIAKITYVLDKNNFFSRNFLSGQPTEQLGTFAGEHGAHDELNASSRCCLSGEDTTIERSGTFMVASNGQRFFAYRWNSLSCCMLLLFS